MNTDTRKKKYFIEDAKLNAFQGWARPTSNGELSSRLSILSYYNKYFPFMKPVIFPLIQLAKSPKFTWTQATEHAWSELKFLLNFALKLKFLTKN